MMRNKDSAAYRCSQVPLLKFQVPKTPLQQEHLELSQCTYPYQNMYTEYSPTRQKLGKEDCKHVWERCEPSKKGPVQPLPCPAVIGEQKKPYRYECHQCKQYVITTTKLPAIDCEICPVTKRPHEMTILDHLDFGPCYQFKKCVHCSYETSQFSTSFCT